MGPEDQHSLWEGEGLADSQSYFCLAGRKDPVKGYPATVCVRVCWACGVHICACGCTCTCVGVTARSCACARADTRVFVSVCTRAAYAHPRVLRRCKCVCVCTHVCLCTRVSVLCMRARECKCAFPCVLATHVRVCPCTQVCRGDTCAHAWVHGISQLCVRTVCFLIHVWHFFAAELGGSGFGGMGSGGGAAYASHPPQLHILVVVSLTW